MAPYVLAAAIAFAAFFVRGFSGFGSALVLTPLVALIFDPRLAVAASAVLGASIGAGIAFQARRQIDWSALRRPLTAALPCIVIGATLLARVDEKQLRKGLGIVIIIFGLRLLVPLVRRMAPHRRWSPRIGYVVGGISGLIGGAFGTGGPPIVVYLENQIDERARLRASILGILLIFDFTRIGSYTYTGILDRDAMIASLTMLPAAFIGAQVGARLHVRVSERVFRSTLGAVLVGSGLLLLLS